MRTISIKICQWLIKKGAINASDVNIYVYGIEALASSLAVWCSVFLLACLTHHLLEAIIFTISFCVVRKYAGGYHASSRIRCYCATMTMYIVFFMLLSITSQVWITAFSLVIVCIAGAIIVAFAPHIHENRVVNRSEANIYRAKSQSIYSIEAVAIILGLILGVVPMLIYALALGLIFATFSLFTAKVVTTENYHIDRRKQNEIY